jgi:solute carrier family 25 carnitine/acylcarnitine transporter 20/29
MTTSQSVWIDSIVGAVAGMVSIVAGHPADTVKAKLQLDDVHRYRSATHCAREILAHDGGVRALFRGVVPPVSTIAWNNAIIFFLYSHSSNVLRRVTGTAAERDLPMASVFLAASFTGVLQAYAVSPFEYAKIQAQLHGSRPFRFLLESVRAHGVASVWRGSGVFALRDISYGPYFVTYELVRRSSLSSHTSESVSSFVAGGAAGVVGWSLAYPFDCIKSRMQASAPHEPRTSIVGDLRQLAAASGNTRALPVVLGRAFVVNGVQFLCYEVSRGASDDEAARGKRKRLDREQTPGLTFQNSPTGAAERVPKNMSNLPTCLCPCAARPGDCASRKPLQVFGTNRRRFFFFDAFFFSLFFSLSLSENSLLRSRFRCRSVAQPRAPTHKHTAGHAHAHSRRTVQQEEKII